MISGRNNFAVGLSANHGALTPIVDMAAGAN